MVRVKEVESGRCQILIYFSLLSTVVKYVLKYCKVKYSKVHMYVLRHTGPRSTAVGLFPRALYGCGSHNIFNLTGKLRILSYCSIQYYVPCNIAFHHQ